MAGISGIFCAWLGLSLSSGSESARRALHCADRQRIVLYFSFIWHAQQAGG